MSKQKSGIKPLNSGLKPEEVESRPYRSYVQECADLLIKYGTDRYGQKHQPLLVTILDVQSRSCPEFPPPTVPTSYGKPLFYHHTGPARPNFSPTPYRNWNPDCAVDLSWENHQAYVWEALSPKERIELSDDIGSGIDATGVRAKSLCIEVDLRPGCGGGIGELIINGKRTTGGRKSGTYWVAGSKHQNATSVEQSIPNRAEFLAGFADNGRASLSGDETFPFFMWGGKGSAEPNPVYIREKAGHDVSSNHKNRDRISSTEWVMVEFERPLEIHNIEALWMDNGSNYRVPVSWRLLYANRMEPSSVVYPEAMTVPWRGEKRLLYWKPRSSDFYEDQGTYRALYELTRILGNNQYAEFANASLASAVQITDSKDMFWWGGHRCYDVFADKKMSPDKEYEQPHEIAIKCPQWERLWEVDAEATRIEIEGIWEWHINNKETGEHDRHNFNHRGVPFSMSGGQFIYAFSFLYTKTDNPVHLERAELIADYHWNHRNKKTNLTPEVVRPEDKLNTNKDESERPNEATLCSYQVVGLHSYYLLKSYELTGQKKFLDYAMTYLKAYAQFAYDPVVGKFFGALWVKDGSPAVFSRLTCSTNLPFGHVDLWQPYQYGSEYALHAAQIYAYAYTLTSDPIMLDTAEKWADIIRNTPPTNGCRTDTWYEYYARMFSKFGTFAGLYGRAISFFVNMYANTGSPRHLEDARNFAREAVSKLYYKGLFRGHPARPYYCAVDDVGLLLVALLQLDRALELGDAVVGEKALPLNTDGKEPMGFDNW